MTRERFDSLNSLGIEVETDLSPILEALNQQLGLQMEHRDSGFHVTVIGPNERKLLENMDDATLAELQAINDDLNKGVGIEVRGIGVIDGATAAVPEKDRQKKTAFLAIEVPALQAFLAKHKLPPKDFHVTLGFVGGDIHFEKTGKKDEKGKDVLQRIEKKADPQYDALLASLPDIQFGGLSGEEKQKEKEKVVNPVKEAKEKLRKAMAEAGLSGDDLVALGFKPGIEMGKVTTAIGIAFNGGEFRLDVSEDVKTEILRRIEKARGGAV